jgi:hypothetical protein
MQFDGRRRSDLAQWMNIPQRSFPYSHWRDGPTQGQSGHRASDHAECGAGDHAGWHGNQTREREWLTRIGSTGGEAPSFVGEIRMEALPNKSELTYHSVISVNTGSTGQCWSEKPGPSVWTQVVICGR